MGKLRVFISSTMRDLSNERLVVKDRLELFNMDPVNAEGLLPDGGGSWDRISSEIRNCDVVVLISGERYGWIPTKGPKSDLGLSVTHLEVKEAESLKIPILPFFKKLDYGADGTSEDAKRRDAFRTEVESWDNTGKFITEYSNILELQAKVGASIIGLLSDRFQQDRISARARTLNHTETATAQSQLTATVLPPYLVEAVKGKKAVLFAGSGMSLNAGLPSAAFFGQKLMHVIREKFPDYEANLVGSALAGIATDVQSVVGRKGLIRAVEGLVKQPQGLQPSTAHYRALDLFDQVVTTNYDMLFEEAEKMRGGARRVINAEIDVDSIPERAIVNLHGSVSQADSLVLTESEVLLLDKMRPRLWNAVCQLLKSKLVVVLGSSLRDPSIVRLFTEAKPAVPGYFVVPEYWDTTVSRVGGWNLQCLRADAEGFFASLKQACESA